MASASLGPAPMTHPQVQERTVFEKIFAVFLVYFWAMQFVRGDSVEIISFELAYYFFVIPSAVLGVAGVLHIASTYPNLNRAATILVLFCAAVGAVSLSRSDLRTLATAGLFTINLLIIFQIRPKISLNLVNGLFIAATVITTIMFFFQYSIYTFIPGLNAHPDLTWRISSYPSAAEGGLFAMVVFLSNLILRGQRFREPMLAFSAYIMLFAGNRTAIFAALVGAAFYVAKSYGLLNTKMKRQAFLVGAGLFFVVSIYSSQIFLVLPFADTDFFKSIFFREEALGQFDTGGQVGTAAVREWIMNQHLSIFAESPWVGYGTFDFMMFNTGYEALDSSTTGSEAFATALLARIGLLSLPFFYVLLVMKHVRSGRREDLEPCAKIGMLFGMITYGSFVNSYDVVFILLSLAISGCIVTANSAVEDTISGRRKLL